jgi:hypothetical protein
MIKQRFAKRYAREGARLLEGPSHCQNKRKNTTGCIKETVCSSHADFMSEYSKPSLIRFNRREESSGLRCNPDY